VSDLPFTAADGIVIAVLLLSGLLAFARGLVHEVLSVGAWVGAIIAVVFGLPLVRPAAHALISEPLLADVAGGAALFILTLIVLSLVTRAVARGVKSSQLNAVDRSLGFLFGLARGALIVCLAYIAVSWLVPAAEQPAWLRQAKALPLIETGAAWLKSLVPAPARHGDAADTAREHMRKVLERERMVRDIMAPQPRAAADAQARVDKGYSDRERRELERLLDNER
jgi:membrane protein required for colicin V production